ncbi:hypothetical protein Tco_0976110 [Tanacetum coccineum]|uniref:Uncharacterized protein n=1 Tax=Tanacetum coccineum TaxID=301880 RepID=A0ABQ5EGA7_9ASTR
MNWLIRTIKQPRGESVTLIGTKPVFGSVVPIGDEIVPISSFSTEPFISQNLDDVHVVSAAIHGTTAMTNSGIKNGTVEGNLGTISSPIGTTDPNTGFVPINVTDSPTSLSLVLIKAPWFLIAASRVEARISLIMFEFSSCLLADSWP